MSIKLSILICTMPKRTAMFSSLVWNIDKQIKSLRFTNDIEILSDNSEVDSIGEKRNRLLLKAKGQYVCFIDDDDQIIGNYIDLLMEGINKGVDCCSLKGIYQVNGRTDGVFEHSIKYNEWKTTENVIKYERYPNHLNCIRADIAKQFKFPEKNFGEDHEWSKQLHESGLLKTEHYIEQPIYFYKKVTRK